MGCSSQAVDTCSRSVFGCGFRTSVYRKGAQVEPRKRPPSVGGHGQGFAKDGRQPGPPGDRPDRLGWRSANTTVPYASHASVSGSEANTLSNPAVVRPLVAMPCATTA